MPVAKKWYADKLKGKVTTWSRWMARIVILQIMELDFGGERFQPRCWFDCPKLQKMYVAIMHRTFSNELVEKVPGETGARGTASVIARSVRWCAEIPGNTGKIIRIRINGESLRGAVCLINRPFRLASDTISRLEKPRRRASLQTLVRVWRGSPHSRLLRQQIYRATPDDYFWRSDRVRFTQSKCRMMTRIVSCCPCERGNVMMRANMMETDDPLLMALHSSDRHQNAGFGDNVMVALLSGTVH